MSAGNDFPEFPVDNNQAELLCFVDAAYANDLRKRRSTTGFAFTYCGGAIVYRSKTQGANALSSTEAELIAAVTAANTACYLRSMLNELGFPQLKPTRIFEDNASTIKIINARASQQNGLVTSIFVSLLTKVWKEQGDVIFLVLSILPMISLSPRDDGCCTLATCLDSYGSLQNMLKSHSLLSNPSSCASRI